MLQIARSLIKGAPRPSDFKIVSHKDFEKLGYSVVSASTGDEEMEFDNTEDAMRYIAYECGYRNFDFDSQGAGFSIVYSSSVITVTEEVEIIVIDKSIRFVPLLKEND